MKNDKVLIKDLPEIGINSALEKFTYYSVGLLGLMRDNDGEYIRLLGSGTLIQVNNIYGILTANHVIESLLFKKSERLGISIRNDLHCFSINKDFLSLKEVGRPKKLNNGPDMAVIILPVQKVGTIKATKSFWNIQKYRDRLSNKMPKTKECLWAVFGCPDIYTKPIDSKKGFIKAQAFAGIQGYSGIEKEWKEGSFDYLRLSVSYESESDPPSSFKGVSGGGVWCMKIIRNRDNAIVFEDPVLAGMAFYETDIINNKRSIICHGWQSIYENVYNALTANHD